MPLSEFTCRLPVPLALAWDWHRGPGALHRLLPPWKRVAVAGSRGDVEHGGQVDLKVGIGPITRSWNAQLSPGPGPTAFTDTQVAGPFTRWEHQHLLSASGDQACTLTDRVTWEPPFGGLGRTLLTQAIAADLTKVFAWRHRRTAADLLQLSMAPARRLRIAVGGASGLVGSSLMDFLRAAGHTVVPLVRPGGSATGIAWDPAAGTIDAVALAACDAVVHLGGHSVAAGRWTATTKQRIRDSRVLSTALLARTVATHGPKILVLASATGWYGPGVNAADERAPAGSGFLAEVVRDWEAAAEPARAAGVRVCHLRIGVVVSRRGGALARMLTPFSLGLGGPIGDGQQLMSWIHLDDLVYALHRAIVDDRWQGPINAVAPAPTAQITFAQTLAHVLHRPCLAPLPAAVVRVMFGEMGQSLLLDSLGVSPRRMQDLGFHWSNPSLDGALRFELA